MNFAAPILGAAGSGAAIGASVSDGKTKGAIKGALIGLGGLASGVASKKIVNATMKRMFGSDINNALEFAKIVRTKGNKAATDFLKSKGYKKEDVAHIVNIASKGHIIDAYAPMALHAAGTASLAYAMKNGNSSKK